MLATLIAIWTDVLFHRTDLRINFPVWIASILGLALFAAASDGPSPADRTTVLATAVLLCSVTTWRDSDALHAFGILGALALLAIGFGLAPGLAVRRVGPVAGIAAAVAVGVSFPVSILRLATSGDWQHAGRERTSVRLLLALRVVPSPSRCSSSSGCSSRPPTPSSPRSSTVLLTSTSTESGRTSGG